MVIPLYLVFVVMFIISCALMVEDYTTSRLGYALLPTQKANEWVIPLVALLPQVGQVGFGYVFATDTNKRWSLIIAVMLWVTDVFTDVFFKAYGGTAAIYGVATAESIIIYSLGSEVMMATSVGMLILLTPAFFEQLGKLFRSLFGESKTPRKTIQTGYQPNKPSTKRYNPATPTYRPMTDLFKGDKP